MQRRLLLTALLLWALGPAAEAQGPTFTSPGASSYAGLGQTTRFSREFNPAFGVSLDGFFDYLTADSAPDGSELSLRLFELRASSWVDPDAWAWIVLSSDDLELPVVEEAAVQYVGDLFGGNTTATAGLFFADFGKQMQMHPEELRTLERPLVLREFLGGELSGVGFQLDDWFALNDTTPLRYSVGVFSDLVGTGHLPGAGSAEAEATVPDRQGLDELHLNARVTAMTETGDASVLQLGTSVRYVPEFSFEYDTLAQTGLSNVVWGVDATWGWTGETGLERLTFGLEALRFDGDIGSQVDDPVTPTVLTVTHDAVNGYYAFGDYAWTDRHSAGIQYSWIEDPDLPDRDRQELDLYYTRQLNKFRRLRLGTTLADAEGIGDSFRVYVQLTAFLGAHNHGLNW